jgi:hypothetical protein
MCLLKLEKWLTAVGKGHRSQGGGQRGVFASVKSASQWVEGERWRDRAGWSEGGIWRQTGWAEPDPQGHIDAE